MTTYANRNAAPFRVVRNDGAVIVSTNNEEHARTLAHWLTRTARDGATFSVVTR